MHCLKRIPILLALLKHVPLTFISKRANAFCFEKKTIDHLLNINRLKNMP